MLSGRKTDSSENLDDKALIDKKGKPKKRAFLIVAILAFITASTIGSYTILTQPKPTKSPVKKAVPVSIAAAVQKTVPIELNVIGTVQAYKTVQIKSQVIGQLIKVHFKQGDFVKAGQVLFTIDKRSLEAQLSQLQAMQLKDEAQVKQSQANILKDKGLVQQAEAAIAKDKSQRGLAEKQTQRYFSLSSDGVVSREQYDQQKATLDSYVASVNQDEAALASAKATLEADLATTNSLLAQVKADAASIRNAVVQLDYTTIRAPISGRTGSLNIDQGNLIKDNDINSLVAIDQINPIYVSFAVPEQYLSSLRNSTEKSQLKVSAFIETDKDPEIGQVTFIDNNIDSTTGTITLKATFANSNNRLWPGQFVNIVLLLKEEPNALLIPAHAVQTGQNSQYVFVLKADNTVEQRSVKVERVVKGFAVIEGLSPGEQVVTDGQMQLTPGSLVKPQKALAEDDEQ